MLLGIIFNVYGEHVLYFNSVGVNQHFVLELKPMESILHTNEISVTYVQDLMD